jgi:hypothetical protein
MVESSLPPVQIYQPYGEAPINALAVVVKTPEGRGNLRQLSEAMRDSIRRSAPGIPLREVLTMDDAVFRVRWVSRFFFRQLVLYTVLAVWITVVGLYGLTADSVRLILKEALVLSLAGVSCGLALALGQIVSRMFVTVSARDSLTLGVVSGALFTVSVLAALVPARHALNLAPATACRTE